MTSGSDEMGSSDILEKTGELPSTGFGELRPEELVLPAGGCSSNPAKKFKIPYFSATRVLPQFTSVMQWQIVTFMK
jgi:hypothetical protein